MLKRTRDTRQYLYRVALTVLLLRPHLFRCASDARPLHVRAEVLQCSRQEMQALDHPVPLHELRRKFAALVSAVQACENFLLVRDVNRVCSAKPRVADVKLPSRQRARSNFPEHEERFLRRAAL